MEPWIQTWPSGIAFEPLDPNPDDIHIEDIAHHLALQSRFAGGTPFPYSVAQHSLLVAAIVEREVYKGRISIRTPLFATATQFILDLGGLFATATVSPAKAEGISIRTPDGEMLHLIDEVEGCLPLAALLHDAAEYALVDLPKPIKDCVGFGEGYHAAEARIERAVEIKFGLPVGILNHPIVRMADQRALATEARDMGLLAKAPRPWGALLEPWPEEDRLLMRFGSQPGGFPVAPVYEQSWRQVETMFLDKFKQLGGKR